MKLPLIVLFVIIGSQAWSQQPPPPQDGPRPLSGSQGSGIKSESLFPPELVMRNQKVIDLTLDQQAAIRAEMVKTLPRFTDLQWQLSSEEETLDSLLKLSRPDEKNVLQQLDKVLAIENEMKHLQLGMMLKIKLILSPDQQNSLRELRRQGQRKGMPPPPPRPEDQ
jgi:Spy/CpxP family protein refolding chaperone